MRRGLGTLVGTVIAGVVFLPTVGVASSGSGRDVRAKIPEPGPGGATVALLTVTETSRTGAVAPPDVRTLDQSRLPTDIRGIAITAPPSSKRRHATFRVYFAINNLATSSAHDAQTGAEELPHLEIELLRPGYGYVEDTIHISELKFPQDCDRLISVAQDADKDFFKPDNEHRVRLKKAWGEQSDPEAILDFIANKLCPGPTTQEDLDGDGPI